MIASLLNKRNLNLAYKQVVANKGAGGVDGMSVTDLKDHLRQNGKRLMEQVREGSYQPGPIKGVEIPKSNGKTRLLGVPTAQDRVFQQALHQVLEPLFEQDFQQHSYGFRPHRNARQAVQQSQRYINEGYRYVVNIDLKNFFDEVNHVLLLELIYKRVKCRSTMRLLRKFLRAPIQINGKLHKLIISEEPPNWK